MVKRIFLSHADTDSELAQLLHDELRRARPDVEVFVSSLPGAIPTGTEWLGEIKRQLKAADAYFALLTPASVQRLWVWFESGAAFMSDRQLVGVCAPGMRLSAVPSPLNAHQLLSLDSPAECEQVFKEFGATVSDPDALCRAIHAAAQAGADMLSKAEGWIGMQVGNRYFAWDGPLDALEDRDPLVCPPGVTETLKATGMVPTFGNADRLQTHFSDGRLQVFLTDRQAWKRPVVNDGKQVLLVHGSHDTAPTAFDVARQVQQRNEQRQRKVAMLHGDTGVRAAVDEFYRLADEIDAVVKQLPDLPLSVERFTADASLLLRYARICRVTVEWIGRYANTLDESRLVVAEWQGYGNRDVQLTSDPPLAETTFYFDVSTVGEYAWRKGTNEPMFFSSVGLADWCVTRLLERAKS